jgi:HAE1 family hydrophobic/amphiphilic exporter-1
MGGTAQNQGMVFLKMKDWDLRRQPGWQVQAIVGRAMGAFRRIRNATCFAFAPPSIIELGSATGFDAQLIDFGGLGHNALMSARTQLLGLANTDPRLVRVRQNGLEDVPQYRVDVDWEKAGALGADLSAIHNSISAAFGGSYVNDFVKGGRVKRVYLQADAPYRMLPSDLEKIYVRNGSGRMVPYASFASGRWTSGSPRLERFNGFPSLNIQGEPAPGKSSGEAMQGMEELVNKLPGGVRLDWSGISYQERMSTSQGPLLYAFSILVIFLCVAALYESWTIPIVNLLMLPLGVFGALSATTLRGLPNDVYFQIGFLTTLGLSTKNAILIIQFIKEQMRQGDGLVRARPVVTKPLCIRVHTSDKFHMVMLSALPGTPAAVERSIRTFNVE